MTFRVLLLLAILSVATVSSFVRAAEPPLTKLKCDDGKGNVYSLSFSVERSKLVSLPAGCEIDVEKRYEPPSFVALQMVTRNDGLIRVGVGTRSDVPEAELISEWMKKADSLCPSAFKMESAPVMDGSRFASEVCGEHSFCKGFRIAAGAIRCEDRQ